MFIYRVTNSFNNKCYIGFDTKPDSKQHRWKEHQRDCSKIDSKFYRALRQYRDSFSYSIIAHADDIISLALEEIKWIEFYDSYKNGYNSTRGGDGFGRWLPEISNQEVDEIKRILSENLSSYNNNVKWHNTTVEDRKEMTSHLHNAEVYAQKSQTLKETYRTSTLSDQKSQTQQAAWDSYSKKDRDYRTEICNNSLAIATEKNSIKIKVEHPDGIISVYNSKKEFIKVHGHIINRVLEKTKKGNHHNGYKAWTII